MKDIVAQLQDWHWANEGENQVVDKEVADKAAEEIERLRTPRHSRILGKVLMSHFGGTDKRLVGVEIGVQRGETSRHLLATFPNLNLVMVDPWKADAYEGHRDYDCVSHLAQEEFDEFRQEAYDATDEFCSRRQVLPLTSVAAAKILWRYTLPNDFVFVDGRHWKEAVYEDLCIYWPLVKSGGLLCGHDYSAKFPGVVAAVDEFVSLDDDLTLRHHPRHIWSIVKP